MAGGGRPVTERRSRAPVRPTPSLATSADRLMAGADCPGRVPRGDPIPEGMTPCPNSGHVERHVAMPARMATVGRHASCRQEVSLVEPTSVSRVFPDVTPSRQRGLSRALLSGAPSVGVVLAGDPLDPRLSRTPLERRSGACGPRALWAPDVTAGVATVPRRAPHGASSRRILSCDCRVVSPACVGGRPNSRGAP